jgi:hypothetical protein
MTTVIRQLADQLEMTINSSKNQIQAHAVAKKVYVCVQITKIGDIDTMNERFQAVFNIESRWVEDQLIDKYDPERHWNPKIYVENIFQDISQDIKYQIERVNHSHRTLIVEKRKIKGLHTQKNFNYIFSC